MTNGMVYLVGAGPGDPGLMTLRALECLSKAQVVIYDFLLDDRILEAVPKSAELIFAGKSGAAHFKEQDEINNLLVEKAQTGKVVVRLKGGDPFVLGRGGEEAAALAGNGIPFEIVPGITSAIAVPAYAGIPVTHRTLASSFAVVTGHEDPAKPDSAINWDKLAKAVDTLVFLMGMQNLPQIVKELIVHGRPPATPVAVIKEGTRPEQKVVTGTLENIAAAVKKAKLGPPAVIVVGEVVKLRETLRWFDNRPLFGKGVLVTRARHQASVLSRLLAERGARPVELPVIDIQEKAQNPELDAAIAGLNKFQWIIFTSANGIPPFFQALRRQGKDVRALNGIKIGVIGPATAAALSEKGIVADFCPKEFTSEGILAGFEKTDISRKRFLLPRADIADKALAQGLQEEGAAEVIDIAVYRTVPVPESAEPILEKLKSGEINVITFTSSSTVTNLLSIFKCEEVRLKNAVIACIGPKTAATAEKAGLKVDILAKEQTIPGLVAAIEEYFREETR